DIDLSVLPGEDLPVLFNEELGAVLQVRDAKRACELLAQHGVAAQPIGRPTPGDRIVLRRGTRTLFDEARAFLRGVWSEATHEMQSLRDDAACADEEQALRCDPNDPGLSAHATFDLDEDVAAPFIARGARPRVAILREQGVNGQVEMAAAF